MSGGMSPSLDPADLSRLHGYPVLELIDEGGFSDAAGARHRRGSALQKRLKFRQTLPCYRAGKDHRVAGSAVAVGKDGAGLLIRQILFIKADTAGNSLLLHGDEEAVHQVQVRLRAYSRHDDERLIHICHCRADECAAARQNPAHIALLLFLARNIKFHIVAGKGLFPVLPKNPLRPAFVQVIRGTQDFLQNSPRGFRQGAALHSCLILPACRRLRRPVLFCRDRRHIIKPRNSSDYSSSHVPESFLINVTALLMVLCSVVPGTVVTSPVVGSVTVAASVVTL